MSDQEKRSDERVGRVRIVRRSGDEYTDIEMREPLVQDAISAEKMTDDQGFEFACAIVSQVTTFDGKKLPLEDVTKLPLTLFFELSQGLMALGLDQLGSALSSSASSPDGGSEKS